MILLELVGLDSRKVIVLLAKWRHFITAGGYNWHYPLAVLSLEQGLTILFFLLVGRKLFALRWKCCWNTQDRPILILHFYAPQLYRQVLLRRVLAMGILSVCPSVCLSVTTRWYTKPRWDRDSGSSPYDSVESLVSNEVIWCRWVRRFPSNEGIKEGYPPYKSLFYHYWLI